LKKLKVEIPNKVVKSIEKLPSPIQEKILEEVVGLSSNYLPDGKRIKKVQGRKNTYRLRIGSYRAIFTIQGEKIFILLVIHRKDLEKKLKDLW